MNLHPRYHSWGRTPKFYQEAVRLRWRSEALPFGPGMNPNPGRSCLPFGNGRSYGDSCLNRGGLLLDTRGLDRFVALDTEKGVVTCESGVLLSEILQRVVPLGWFLPVVPGTQWVTVGGAIANDIHGKNQNRAGTFGCHVTGLELLRSDGTRRWCSPSRHPRWFQATVGGMGLTGLIVQAAIALKRIPGDAMAVATVPFSGLDEFFDLAARFDARFEYTAAWADCVARGRGGIRGLMMGGDHAQEHPGERFRKRVRAAIPVLPPVSVVNRASARVFNTLHFRGRQKPSRKILPYPPFFFPLDGIDDWNRLYGPRGFFQHQCVLPMPGAREAVQEVIDTACRMGAEPMLAVFKCFGERPSPGWMSFPMPGITLALDFANQGPGTLRMLDVLDRLVMTAGGRVNPYKDARMSPACFTAGHPRWADLDRMRDPNFSSSFWRRVTRR